jgi:hypothetical protein
LYFQQYGEHWSAQQFLPNITHYSVTRDEVTCDSVKSIKLLPKTSKPQQVSNLTNKQQQQQPPQPQNTSDSESNQFTMIIKDAPSPLSPPSETVEIIGEKKDKEIVQDNEVTTTTTKIPFSEVRNVNHSHKTSTKKKKSSSHLRQKKQEKAPFTENSLKNYKLKKIPNEKEKFRDLSDDDSVLDEVLKYQYESLTGPEMILFLADHFDFLSEMFVTILDVKNGRFMLLVVFVNSVKRSFVTNTRSMKYMDVVLLQRKERG